MTVCVGPEEQYIFRSAKKLDWEDIYKSRIYNSSWLMMRCNNLNCAECSKSTLHHCTLWHMKVKWKECLLKSVTVCGDCEKF